MSEKASVIAEVERVKLRLVRALPPNTEATILLAALTGFARGVLKSISVATGQPYESIAAAFVARIARTTATGDDLS